MQKFYVRCGDIKVTLSHYDARSAALKVIKAYYLMGRNFQNIDNQFTSVNQTGFENRIPSKEYPSDLDEDLVFMTDTLLIEALQGM